MAENLVKFLQAQGGAHTLEDFAEFEPEWVEPISTTYRGWQVYELPPNGQGVAALSMLNIMENFPLKDYGHNSAAALHVMIEAKKLAYADMARYVGDPRFGAGAGARRCCRRTWPRQRAGADRHGQGVVQGAAFGAHGRRWTRTAARPSTCRRSIRKATSSR